MSIIRGHIVYKGEGGDTGRGVTSHRDCYPEELGR